LNSHAKPSEPGEIKRRKSLGRAGENVAKAHLLRNGFRILAVNYRRSEGEADIVAIKGDLLIFCEIKTRIGSGEPREGYGKVQQKRLAKVSEIFVHENRHLLPYEFDLRYDLVIVGKCDDGKLEVKEYIEDAIGPL